MASGFGVESPTKMTGIHQQVSTVRAPGDKMKKPAAPTKRIAQVDHLGGMLSGFKRRMSGPNSRLGPPKSGSPKRPYVRKGKVS
jgi:hypothetical protein